MAKKLTKPELLDKAAGLGIDVPEGATAAQIAKLIAESGKDAPKETKHAVKTVKCDGFKALNVRVGPSKSAPVCGELANGAKVEVLSAGDGWAKVDGGFVAAEYLA